MKGGEFSPPFGIQRILSNKKASGTEKARVVVYLLA